jgi:RHS repeat-associated protein
MGMMERRSSSSAQCSELGRHSSGKKRDAESGLDYFGARYFSGMQGRFLSVDPENAGAKHEDPQSWNAYAYARNNPLKYTDPDGLMYCICKYGGACREDITDDAFRYIWDGLDHFDHLDLHSDYAIVGNLREGYYVLGHMLYSYKWLYEDPIELDQTANAAIGAVFAEGIFGGAALAEELSKNAAIASGVQTVASKSLVDTLNISEHAAKAMAEHGVTREMVRKAIEKGQRFWDSNNNSIVYVLQRGMASGKDLAVAKNPVTNTINTVFVNVKTIRPRFQPIK